MRALLFAAVAVLPWRPIPPPGVQVAAPVGAPASAPASARAGETLTFAAREGTSVTKQFSLQHELTVQKIELAGADAGAMSQQQLELSSQIQLEVADTYKKVFGGRPLELQRVYKASTFHVDFAFTDASGNKMPEAWDADTPLKEKSVVFVWVPEEKDYSRHYDQVESLEEYLMNLVEDLDLRCLLPGREVKEGESWKIELSTIANLFTPGGNIPMQYVKGGNTGLTTAVAAGVGGSLFPVFAGTVKGNCTATWSKTQPSEGGRLAAIELAFDVDTEADRTEIARRMMRQDEDNAQSPVRHAGVRWKFTGSGTLLWNLDAGRFEKLDLGGKEEVASDIQFARGEETASQLLSMAGGLKISASVVPPKK